MQAADSALSREIYEQFFDAGGAGCLGLKGAPRSPLARMRTRGGTTASGQRSATSDDERPHDAQACSARR